MALIKAIEIKETTQKRIDIENDLLKEMELYMEMIGADSLKDNEGVNHVINESLRYVLSRDNDFKKFKKEREKKEVDIKKEIDIKSADDKNGESHK